MPWDPSKSLDTELRIKSATETPTPQNYRQCAERECLQQNWGGGHTDSKGDIHVGDKRGNEQRDKTIYVGSVPQENLLRQWECLCVLSNTVTAHLLLLCHHSSDRTVCIEGSLSEAPK